MRKIEQQMLQAMGSKSRQSVTLGNTTVTHDKATAHDVRVYLHGNLIAVLSADRLRVTLAGWNTNTTKSRVNAILGSFAKSHEGIAPRISNVKSEPYCSFPHGGGKQMTADEWLTFDVKVWC